MCVCVCVCVFSRTIVRKAGVAVVVRLVGETDFVFHGELCVRRYFAAKMTAPMFEFFLLSPTPVHLSSYYTPLIHTRMAPF